MNCILTVIIVLYVYYYIVDNSDKFTTRKKKSQRINKKETFSQEENKTKLMPVPQPRIYHRLLSLPDNKEELCFPSLGHSGKNINLAIVTFG